MTITLDVNGNQYDNFTSATCELRLDSIADGFSFEATATEAQPLPFKGGESCSVYVANKKVLTGHIEVVNVSYDSSSHSISVSGRSKTADLLDSTLDNIDDIRGEDLTLKQLIELVIKSIGSDIKVIDEVNPKPLSFAEDLASPEVGDNAFQFIEKYSRKRQVLLTSNPEGDLVITKNSGQATAGAVQHIIGAEDNNVISCNFSYDTTGRFNVYRFSSGMNPVTLNQAGDTDLASLVNQSGGVFDSEIRKGRQLILISESPYSSSPCKDRSKWEADIRRARGLAYDAVVSGFQVGEIDGDLWQINKLYQIVDDYVGKVETMLCNSVTFSYSADEGSNTSLGFVSKNAYTLFVEPPADTTEAGNVA